LKNFGGIRRGAENMANIPRVKLGSQGLEVSFYVVALI